MIPGLKRKVLLLGDGLVGKTSLIRRFVVDEFSDGYVATIGAKVTKKDMRVEQGTSTLDLSMIIWDVLGQKGFNAVQGNSFLGSKGVVLVYDATRPETGDSLRDYWVPNVRKVSPDASLVLFANKIDLISSRGSAEEMAARLATELGCEYYLTSAKTGESVESGFNHLASALAGEAKEEIRALISVPPLENEADTIGVADRIMVDFCNDFGGIEAASPIMKEQFDRAGFDFRNPTMQDLLKAIDLLAEAEMNLRPIPDIEKKREKWLEWARGIRRP